MHIWQLWKCRLKLEKEDLHCPDTCRSPVTMLCTLFQRAITGRRSKGTTNLNMSANFRRVKQQSASPAPAAHGLGPWAVWFRDLHLRAQAEMEPKKSLMPCTVRPFHSRSRSSSAGAEGEEKHFDRPMKNLFEMSLGVGKFVHSSKSYRGNDGRGQGWGFTPFPRPGSNALSTSTRLKMTSWIPGVFFTSSVSVWFTHPFWQPVLVARANRTASTMSRCAQRFVQKRASKREKLNMREHQRIDFSWQQSSQLDFYSDKLWQCTGSKQQPRTFSCFFLLFFLQKVYLSPSITCKRRVGSSLSQKCLLGCKDTEDVQEITRSRKFKCKPLELKNEKLFSATVGANCILRVYFTAIKNKNLTCC